MNVSADPTPRTILAAGLSPAWQQILVFDQFHLGEVNRAREVHWSGSGKVLNVGIALAYLCGATNEPGGSSPRMTSKTLSTIGGPAKAAIDREFDELKIHRRWIVTAAPTRICTTILDRSTRTTTELVENAAPVTASELAAFQQAYVEEVKNALVVLTGSLPAGAPPAFYGELLRHTEGRAVIDVRGPELLAALEHRPFLVKPNREELGKTVGRALDDDQGLRDAMNCIQRLGAEWVVVSDGPRAVWATDGAAFFRFQPPAAATAVNPIASGDCLAAGIAWAIAQDTEPLEAIRVGIAAAVDNVSQLLPARIDPSRIATILPDVNVERVKL